MVNIKKFLSDKIASITSPASLTMLSMPGTMQRAETAYQKAMQKIQAGEDSMKTANIFEAFTAPAKNQNPFMAALGGGLGAILPQLLGNALGTGGPASPQGMDLFKQELIKGTGKQLSELGGEAVRGMASKATSAIGSIGDSSARNAIIKRLKKEDPVIARADDKLLMEAYDTMVQFAPTLSKDINAVRSYLREAVLTGSGPNYATIKMLADAERAVTGGGGGHGGGR